MLAPIKIVSTGIPAGKKEGHQPGTVKGNDFQSGCERSLIHKNPACLNSIGVVEADEHRKLEHHGQTATQRIHAIAPVKLHNFLVELLFVILVFFL